MSSWPDPADKRVTELEEKLRRMEGMLSFDRNERSVHFARDVDVIDSTRQPAVLSVPTPTSTRRPGEPQLTAIHETDGRLDSKPYLPAVKLGVYRGDTSLETFLAKFENCSRYLNWNERDRLFYLSNALE